MEKDITQDLCSPQEEGVVADDSASVPKDNAMEMIFSTAGTSAAENVAESSEGVETEETIVRLLQSGESGSLRSPPGQPLPVQETPVSASPAPIVPKTFVYQPQEILDMLETMKRIGFSAYLEVVPIHHNRYHIQLQSNDSSSFFSLGLIGREEEIEEWDMPDMGSDNMMDLSVWVRRRLSRRCRRRCRRTSSASTRW